MDSDDTGASSPCFAHELEQSADGSFHAVDPQQRRDVMRWRKSERQRQIDARLAIPASRRAEMAAQIARRVLPLLEPLKDRVVSFYWPLRGEPDLRALMREVIAAGGACALPVVVQKNAPLAFHAYAPGDRLEKGFWNIPVPARVRAVVPDVVFAPVVGFDPGCYRLGYGRWLFRPHARRSRPRSPGHRGRLFQRRAADDLSTAARHSPGRRGDRGGGAPARLSVAP